MLNDSGEFGKIIRVRQPLTLSNEHLTTTYDPIYRALWCKIKSSKTPVFSLNLLKSLREFQDTIAKYCSENPKKMPKYLIWMTDSDKVFNLGLDLDYVHQNIISANEKALSDYIQLCIDVLYINLLKLDISPLITFSLIRGKAYGGGFESALSSDIIVTENNAQCCFPEVRYNLLPSFGTLKMLLRKYHPNAIQMLLFQGKKIQLAELKALGFIEEVVNCDQGVNFIRNKIHQIHSRHALYHQLFEAKYNSLLITHKELDDFRDNWIKTVLQLKAVDLRRLKKLSHAQKSYCK